MLTKKILFCAVITSTLFLVTTFGYAAISTSTPVKKQECKSFAVTTLVLVESAKIGSIPLAINIPNSYKCVAYFNAQSFVQFSGGFGGKIPVGRIVSSQLSKYHTFRVLLAPTKAICEEFIGMSGGAANSGCSYFGPVPTSTIKDKEAHYSYSVIAID